MVKNGEDDSQSALEHALYSIAAPMLSMIE